MYVVNLYDNPNRERPTVIHSPTLNGPKLDGRIKKDINLIPSFTVTTGTDNYIYSNTRPFQSFIDVRNSNTNDVIFEGRILDWSERMSNDGEFEKTIHCEGEEGYLHDSVSRHLEYRGTPKNLMMEILNWHNSQVEEYKHFTLGEMTVTNNTDNLYVYLSATRTTYEEIKDKFLDRLGGEFRVRKEHGIRYLDYVENIGEESNTEIRIAKNLMQMSKKVDPTEIVTRLTPLGERIPSEDELATDASEERLTIASVNNGKHYIDRPDLISELGIQGGSKTWDDITEPARLLTTGQRWLNDQKLVLNQFVISALDLSVLGYDIDSFNLGWSYPVWNPIMGINDRLRVIGIEIDINNPQDSGLTIGDKFQTMSEYTTTINREYREAVSSINVLKTDNTRIRNSIDDIRRDIEGIDYIDGDLDSVKKTLDELLGIDYPEYWRNHVNNKIRNIRAIRRQIRDPISFIFITDLHVDLNEKHSFDLVYKLTKDLPINNVIVGGDLVANPPITPKSSVIRQINEVWSGFSNISERVSMLMGNHDNNTSSGKWDETLLPEEMYAAMFSPMEGLVTFGPYPSKYHYKDEWSNKIRYICLDSIDFPYIQVEEGLKYKGAIYAYRQEQIEWLINVALDTPDDWSVVIFSHTDPYQEGVLAHDYPTYNQEIVRGVLEAYNTGGSYSKESEVGVPEDMYVSVTVNFEGGGGSVIAWFSGHVHYDNSVMLPEGFPLVTTLNDGATRWLDAPVRTPGTIREQAFDVVTVDKYSRKMHLTRIGAGVDREIEY